MEKILDRFKSDSPSPTACTIRGDVPSWLSGSLYRNGPALFKIGDQEMKHVFDGMACVHRYTFDNGRVSFQTRLLETDAYKKNKMANRIVSVEFGTAPTPDPCKTLFNRYFTYYVETLQITDNDLVNLMQLGDQLYAMTETPLISRIDPYTLDKLEKVDLKKYVSVALITAHPQQESDGTVYNFGTYMGPQSYYNLIKIPPADKGDTNPVQKACSIGRVACQWPTQPNYFHSFAMTENYFILMEMPVGFNILELATRHVVGKAIIDTMHFYPEYKVKIHVLHKYTGATIPVEYVSKPFFFFHHINAYEEDKQLVVDVCGYENTDVLQDLKLESLRREGFVPSTAIFRRFVLPLNVHKGQISDANLVTLPYTSATATLLEDGVVYCSPEVCEDLVIELPRINYERFNGKKYRFAYGLSCNNGFMNKIVKIDLKSKEKYLWGLDGFLPSEPLFVAAPGGHEEDDGVLLSPILNIEGDQQAFLLVLDAKSMREIGRAEIPQHIDMSLTFHGIFSPAPK